MIYAFQDSTRLQLQQAFSSAQLFLEKKRNHDSKNWEYYFAVSFYVPRESVLIREVIEVLKFDEVM